MPSDRYLWRSVRYQIGIGQILLRGLPPREWYPGSGGTNVRSMKRGFLNILAHKIVAVKLFCGPQICFPRQACQFLFSGAVVLSCFPPAQ
jgi:hypothetical protein